MRDKEIKMIALDLDGTTLRSDHTLSPRTMDAFRASMEKGVHIVVSTGRVFSALPKVLFDIKGLEYVVNSNGAQITELATMKRIYENYMKPETVEQVVGVLRGTGISVETFVDGLAYADADEFYDIRDHGSTFRDANYVLTTRHPIPNILDFMLENKDRIENISLNFEFIEDKEKMWPVLAAIDDLTLTSSFAHNFEMGGATTSKADALKFLMDRLGITKDHLMACGDSPNDSRMIELARIGVVMGNANEQMKEKADYITDTCNDDGVAKAIEKFVL